MRLGQHAAQHIRRASGIDQIVDHQPALAVADIGWKFDDLGFVPVRAWCRRMIADEETVSIMRISSSRATIAAGTSPPRVTAINPFHGPSLMQPPCQSFGIAMQFFPTDGEIFLLANIGHRQILF